MDKKTVLLMSLIALIVPSGLQAQDSKECTDLQQTRGEEDIQKREEAIQKCLEGDLAAKREKLVKVFKAIRPEGGGAPQSAPVPAQAAPVQPTTPVQPVVQPTPPAEVTPPPATRVNPYNY